ncbi:MAG TPA: hypothetical protein VIQ05_07365 [Tardiphaga sp.]
MATTSAARPAKKSARAGVVSRVRKTPAKTTAAKKPVAKKAVAKKAVKKAPVRKAAAKKPVGPRTAKRLLKEKRDAAVLARKKTQDATLLRVDQTDVVIDEHDDVAQQKLARLRRTAVDKASDPPPATGIALVERVTRAVERELMQIETIVGGHHVKPQQRSEAERRARTLASLARTLTEVRRLRAADELQRPAHGPSAARDLDAFRRILWQRLEGMVGRATAVPAADHEPGGNG